MAAYKTGTFVRSKYYTLFCKTPLKWIPRSKPGASKSRSRWTAHTRRGNVWEYPLPPPPPPRCNIILRSLAEYSALGTFVVSASGDGETTFDSLDLLEEETKIPAIKSVLTITVQNTISLSSKREGVQTTASRREEKRPPQGITAGLCYSPWR